MNHAAVCVAGDVAFAPPLPYVFMLFILAQGKPFFFFHNLQGAWQVYCSSHCHSAARVRLERRGVSFLQVAVACCHHLQSSTLHVRTSRGFHLNFTLRNHKQDGVRGHLECVCWVAGHLLSCCHCIAP